MRLDAQADAYYAQGEHAAETGDKYIRVTVILATVLFIVAAIEILQLPGPPA